MRASVAKPRPLPAGRAGERGHRQRAGNVALSATDVQLTRELETAQARLARLRTQLGSTRSSEDYEAVRREYESLEAAIQALNQQIEGGQR